MKITATQYVNKALEFEKLTEHPSNSNNVIFNTHYYGREVHDRDTGPNAFYPWCVTYPWDIFRMLGAGELFCGGKKTASSGYILNQGAKLGCLISDPSLLRKGDIAVLDFPGTAYKTDHTVIVISNNPEGKTFHTIEGNTSANGSQSNGGQVLQKDRPYSLFVGAFRPDYLPEDTHVPVLVASVSSKLSLVADYWEDVLSGKTLANGDYVRGILVKVCRKAGREYTDATLYAVADSILGLSSDDYWREVITGKRNASVATITALFQRIDTVIK